MQGTTLYEPLAVERIIWNAPLGRAVAGEVERRGARRPLIVASPTCRRRTGTIDALAASLPVEVAGIFDGIEPHVSPTSVMAVIAAVREADADLIVTVGGGSTIDTVKVALIGIAAGIDAPTELASLAIRVDAQGQRIPSLLPPPPIRQICAPTTLSSAEFSDLAGCTDPATQTKQLFSSPGIGSATVILDPRITLDTPIDIWLSTGVRALDHAVESICSLASNPYVDALSIEAVRILAAALPRTRNDPGDLTARTDAQFGVWMACSGLNRVPWGASHGLGHQVGAVARIPHGYCSCILLPHVLAYNRSANPDRQALVEVALGADGRTAGEAVADLVATLGLPQRLRDVGVESHMLPAIARTSMANMFVRQNPRPIRAADDLLEILESAF